MEFTITRIRDHVQAPDPGKDVHWWAVDTGRGRPGWVWTSASAPPPDDEWIVEELHRQRAKLGNALEGSLMAKGGMQLRPPRPDDS